jgi:hypothetical protein
VNSFKPGIYATELGVHQCDKQPDQRGIEEHRNADHQVKLLIRHQD